MMQQLVNLLGLVDVEIVELPKIEYRSWCSGSSWTVRWCWTGCGWQLRCWRPQWCRSARGLILKWNKLNVSYLFWNCIKWLKSTIWGRGWSKKNYKFRVTLLKSQFMIFTIELSPKYPPLFSQTKGGITPKIDPPPQVIYPR